MCSLLQQLLLSVEPNVTLAEITSTSHGTMLVCSAYDFYPKDIRMSWHLNGQEVTTGVSFSGAITNGDWTYQAHTYLESEPKQLDAGISCVVEHPTLRKPQILGWGKTHGYAGLQVWLTQLISLVPKCM